MDTLPHTRVIQHLSRFSLSADAGPLLVSSVEKPKFYLILLPDTSSSIRKKDSNLVQLAATFGCEGVIMISEASSFARAEEQKDAEPSSLELQPLKVYHVTDVLEASLLVRQTLGVLDVVGVIANASPHKSSMSISHPKAFWRSAAFVFIDEQDEIQSKLASALCDRFVHVHHSLPSKISPNGLSVDACASIVFFRFAESFLITDPRHRRQSSASTSVTTTSPRTTPKLSSTKATLPPSRQGPKLMSIAN